MAIKDKDFQKVRDIGCVVLNSSAPENNNWKEGYVYKLKNIYSGSLSVEIDSRGNKNNGWNNDYFNIATQAEAEVYNMINSPYHINQVDILLGVNTKDRGEVLIAAAKLRGFVMGAKVRDLDDPDDDYLIENNFCSYYKENDDLYVGGNNGPILIYRQGKWSEIVEKAPKKNSIKTQRDRLSRVLSYKTEFKSNSMKLPDKWWEKVEVGDTLRCVEVEGSEEKGIGWERDLEFIVSKISPAKNQSNNKCLFFGNSHGVYYKAVVPVKCKNLNISSDEPFHNWMKHLEKTVKQVYSIPAELLDIKKDKEVQEILPIKIRKKKKRVKVEILSDSKIKE